MPVPKEGRTVFNDPVERRVIELGPLSGAVHRDPQDGRWRLTLEDAAGEVEVYRTLGATDPESAGREAVFWLLDFCGAVIRATEGAWRVTEVTPSSFTVTPTKPPTA
jgi:hypothetical protein